MIEIDFVPRTFDKSWRKSGWPARTYRGTLTDLVDLSRDDFTSWFFQVDVKWKIDGVDLSFQTPGLPIIDFILMLDLAEKELGAAGVSSVDTTDTQHVFHFKLQDGMVRIRTNYLRQMAIVEKEEFYNFVSRAARRAVEILVEHHPVLGSNTFLLSLVRPDLGGDRRARP